MGSEDFQVNFVNSMAEVTAAPWGGETWLWAWIIYSGNASGPGVSGGPYPATNFGWLGSGFSVYAPGMARATGMLRTWNSDETNTKLAVDFNSDGSNRIIGGSADHHHSHDIPPGAWIDEEPYASFGFGYYWYGAIWEFSENTIVDGSSLGWNAKMTTWNNATPLIGITPTLPIWAQFNGVIVTQG
jgi:hypothetical protein